MQIETLPGNVDLIETGNKKIYLVGTAHISQESVELSEKIIREINPESVVVELCNSRYVSLKDPDRWKNTDIVSVIKSGKIYVLMAQLILAGFQKKLGNQLSVKPGSEMVRSFQVAEEIGAKTVLADRDVKITLKRTWAALGFWSGAKLMLSMIMSLFSSEKITKEEIEDLKSSASLDLIMKEFSEKMPQLRAPLIDERDKYLAEKIRTADGQTVVAIVGAGHVPGIKQYILSPTDLTPLEEIPPRGIASRIFSWMLPGFVLAALVYAFFSSGKDTSFEMMQAWFWITGCAGALGSALALAHPLTIITTFFVTPFATLHPLIAAGWIGGLLEAYIRKPTVSDFETVVDDMSSLKGIWSNRISRIIIVIALTNIFSTIGMIIGAKVLATLAIK